VKGKGGKIAKAKGEAREAKGEAKERGGKIATFALAVQRQPFL
jgi:hypothetical protein